MARFRIVQITNNGLPPLFAIFDRTNRSAAGTGTYRSKSDAEIALRWVRASTR